MGREMAAHYRRRAKRLAEYASKLQKRISYITDSTTSTKDMLDSANDKMQSQPESAVGLIIKLFENRELAVWKPQYDNIINNIRRGIEDLEKKKSKIEDMVNYYNHLADMEMEKDDD